MGEVPALGGFQDASGLGSRVGQTPVYCFVSIEIVVASRSTLIPMSVLISSKKYTSACSRHSPEGLADARGTCPHPLGLGRHLGRPIWLFWFFWCIAVFSPRAGCVAPWLP